MPAHYSFYQKSSPGFSLMELLVVMGILGTLFGLTTVDLTNLLPRANLSAATEKISLDLNDQQLKAMVGDTEGQADADFQGVYFQTNQYILFHGASYSAAQASNVTIQPGDEFQISTNFPNQSVVFQRVSGEVVNYASESSTITVRNTANDEVKTLTINRIGVVSGN